MALKIRNPARFAERHLLRAMLPFAFGVAILVLVRPDGLGASVAMAAAALGCLYAAVAVILAFVAERSDPTERRRRQGRRMERRQEPIRRQLARLLFWGAVLAMPIAAVVAIDSPAVGAVVATAMALLLAAIGLDFDELFRRTGKRQVRRRRS